MIIGLCKQLPLSLFLYDPTKILIISILIRDNRTKIFVTETPQPQINIDINTLLSKSNNDFTIAQHLTRIFVRNDTYFFAKKLCYPVFVILPPLSQINIDIITLLSGPYKEISFFRKVFARRERECERVRESERE